MKHALTTRYRELHLTLTKEESLEQMRNTFQEWSENIIEVPVRKEEQYGYKCPRCGYETFYPGIVKGLVRCGECEEVMKYVGMYE